MKKDNKFAARITNSIVGGLFLVSFILSVISFSTFLSKSVEIDTKTLYGNESFGNCILYADENTSADASWPRVHLGKSEICQFVIYSEFVIAVYSLVFTFVMFFKVIISFSLIHYFLLVELIISTVFVVFQFLVSVVLTSGLHDTCKATSTIHENDRCTDHVVPERNDNENSVKFYGSILVAQISSWIGFIILLGISAYLIIVSGIWFYRKVKKCCGKHTTLVEEEIKDDAEL